MLINDSPFISQKDFAAERNEPAPNTRAIRLPDNRPGQARCVLFRHAPHGPTTGYRGPRSHGFQPKPGPPLGPPSMIHHGRMVCREQPQSWFKPISDRTEIHGDPRPASFRCHSYDRARRRGDDGQTRSPGRERRRRPRIATPQIHPTPHQKRTRFDRTPAPQSVSG